MNRRELLEEIKSLGADYRNGSELINMMDFYNVNSLSEITDEMAEKYLEKISEEK